MQPQPQSINAEPSAQPHPARAFSAISHVIATARSHPLAIVLALVLLQGCLYVFVVPPWQHPDEPTHFEHARLTAGLGRLPAPNEVSLPLRKQIADSMLRHAFWRGITQPALNDQSLSTPYTSPLGIYTQSQPRLYYAVAAVWLLPWLGQPIDTQVYALRMLSVLLSLVVVACAFVSTRWLLPSRPYVAFTVAGFIGLLPGYADIMSAVNNDVLANALGAIFFTLAAFLLTQRTRWHKALGILVLMGLTLAAAVATKATALALVVTVPLGLLAAIGVRVLLLSTGPRVWRSAVIVFVVMVLAAAVLLGLAWQATLGQHLAGVTDWLARYLRVNLSGTLKNLLGQPRVSYAITAQIVFESFWAVFGWRHIYVATPLYWLPALATLVAMTGLAVGVVRLLHGGLPLATRRRIGLYGTVAFTGVVVAWAAAVARSQADQGMGPYQSHGRYVYVALVPFAVLFVLGVVALVPERWRRRAAVVVLLASAAFQLVAFWGFLYPYYY